MMVGVVLAACGGGGQTSASGGATGEIDRDATLTVAWPVPALPLDPHTTISELGATPYLTPLYDRLTQIVVGPNGQPAIAPMLATKWEFSPDGLSAVFTLRTDVTFSDGAKLDANAVKLSVNRALTNPKSTAKATFSIIKSVDVVDPTTVKITTNRPAGDLLESLAGTYGSIISPNAINNPDLETKPVGSGPYELASLKLGDSATYTRRAGYWDPEAQKAAKIVLRGVADGNTRLNALRSDQIDVAWVSLPITKQAQQLGDGFGFYSYPATSNLSVYLKNTAGPLKDLKVRQALNYALDRNSIAANVLSGQCAPNSQPLAAGYPGHLQNPPVTYDFDPAKAKALLAEAGYPNGFDLKIVVPAGISPQVELASIIQYQWNAIGVRSTVTSLDAPQAVGGFGPSNFDALVHVRNAGATPASTLEKNYLTARAFPGDLPDSIRSSVLSALNPTLDQAAVTKALESADGQITGDALNITICDSPTQVAFRDKVVGFDKIGSFYRLLMDLRYLGVTK